MTQTGGELALRERLVQRVDQLPVLPYCVTQLMGLDPDDEDYFDQVLAIVEIEPNFSTRVLASANSAASASQSAILSLRTAIARLGSQSASNLVIALAVTRVFVPHDDWEKSLWRHAVQVAIAARALAHHASDPDVDPAEAYVCGLLHDVGRFVMFSEAPEKLRLVDEGDWDDPTTLVTVEKRICGVSHAELGALACTKWHLPEVIVEMIRHHHDPLPDRCDSRLAKLTSIVHMADLAMFPSAIPGSPGLHVASDEELCERILDKLPDFIAIDLAGFRELLLSASLDAEVASLMLGIA